MIHYLHDLKTHEFFRPITIPPFLIQRASERDTRPLRFHSHCLIHAHPVRCAKTDFAPEPKSDAVRLTSASMSAPPVGHETRGATSVPESKLPPSIYNLLINNGLRRFEDSDLFAAAKMAERKMTGDREVATGDSGWTLGRSDAAITRSQARPERTPFHRKSAAQIKRAPWLGGGTGSSHCTRKLGWVKALILLRELSRRLVSEQTASQAGLPAFGRWSRRLGQAFYAWLKVAHSFPMDSPF
jgi:hypothetical protein